MKWTKCLTWKEYEQGYQFDPNTKGEIVDKVLVVAPHHCDAEIGCGGLIARLVEEGKHPEIAVCVSEGENEIVPWKVKTDEQRASAWLLNCPVHFLDIAPTSQFDITMYKKFVTEFDHMFSQYDTVLLPFPSYDSDYRVVWNAGLTCFRPGRLDRIELLAYEHPVSLAHSIASVPVMGKLYVELQIGHMQAKVQSIAKFTSQMIGKNAGIHGQSGVKALAGLRGMEIGTVYAELHYSYRRFM